MSSAGAVPSAEPTTSPSEQTQAELIEIEPQRAVAAEGGDVGEQYKLALLLAESTEAHKTEALAIFRKLAIAGHSESKAMIADHAKSQAAARREEAARSMLDEWAAQFEATIERAAQSGDVEAQYNIAVLLKDGTTKQKSDAFAIFCKLADAGHAKSKRMVGWCYHSAQCGAKEDTTRAFEFYRQAAELGDAEAQYELAVQYELDQQDAQTSVKWYRKAAEQGHSGAQHNLAVILRRFGRDNEAFDWALKAATQGHVGAQNTVGLCYDAGTGCEKDAKMAVQWYRKAAEQGHSLAQYNLAMMLQDAVGIDREDTQAFAWLQKAATSGFAEAQVELARCYAAGRGAQQDIGKALEWLAKAEAGGQKAAVVERMYLRADSASQFLFERWKAFSSTARRPPRIETRDLIGPFVSLRRSTFGQAVRCQYLTAAALDAVVVKVPKDERISEAWLNEMLALTAVPHHVNVLRLYGICSDFECTDGQTGVKLKPPLSFVTHSCEQGSIADYFSRKENAGNSAKFLLPWALDIARGLAHLHKHGCVHRDLAARNVFIDKDKRAIIGDLGLARPLDEAKGVFKSEHKSAAYPADAAPQVLQSEEYSPASDVFSFGLTLFEIATECKFADAFAFSRSSLSAQAAQIEQLAAKGYPELVSKLPASVPAWMVELMLRCLAFEPEKRPRALQIAQGLLGVLCKDDVLRILSPSVQLQIAHELVTSGSDEQKRQGFETLSSLAKAGHAKAKNTLGWCYHQGCGVPKDDHKSFECYLDAAKRGVGSAQYNLGLCYATSRGTDRDDLLAFVWYRKAAELGQKVAMFALSRCFADGVGTYKDKAEAKKWLEKAEAAGYKMST